MTKTTEELKREMFKALAEMKGRIEINYSIKDMLRGVDEFEHALEDCLQSMREDRDTLRNKLQAFEFANRSAAELLSEALREPSGLRKSSGSMVHQNQPEVVSQDGGAVMPGYQFSWEECQHANIYKDIAAGPRHYRCVDCGARGQM